MFLQRRILTAPGTAGGMNRECQIIINLGITSIIHALDYK